MKLPKPMKLMLPLAAMLFFSSFAFAQNMRGDAKIVIVGEEEMFPTQDIVANAVNSDAHTTLVKAVQAAGLVETLQSPGPFTVFAPTNDAFENLPAGTLMNLLEEENRESLVRVLTYHVVPGNLSREALMEAVEEGGGRATLKTAAGDNLYVTMNGPGNLMLMDEHGTRANISIYDVFQSNGVIHVIDTVVLPE